MAVDWSGFTRMMANKHYHVFDGSGLRVGAVLELPSDATEEDVLTELLVTHAEELPALNKTEAIRFVGAGQTVNVYGDDDQICMLVILPA
jgi:hypothetical protein